MDKNQLSDKFTSELLNEIQNGKYAYCHKLPSEADIAKQFGISRTLVRDCLSVLEREGFVSRKHGIGTIINKHVLNVKTRLDLEQEYLEMIRATNKIPEVSYVNVDKVYADFEIARKLKIKEGESLIKINRVITADGVQAIYCEDYIIESMIIDKNYESADLEKPIFEFLKKYCNTEVYMDLSEIRAIVADEYLKKVLNLKLGIPILYIDEVGYDFFGQPVLYAKEYYVDGIFKHIVMRKMQGSKLYLN